MMSIVRRIRYTHGEKILMRLVLPLLLFLSGSSVQAAVIDAASDTRGAIGHYAWLMPESGAPLELDEVRERFAAGEFVQSEDAYLDFGIGASPVWLRFEISNDSATPVQRRLSIENSWLDHIEIYFLTDGSLERRYQLGDALPFSGRPIEERFFSLDHRFAPGLTILYIRVATPDPMVLPVYLGSTESWHERQIEESYSYGLIYGVIGALLLYNLVLYFGLKSTRHLFYSLYLLFFLLMNLSYTGHGYRWLWPDATTWQLWSNPVLMVAYCISGLLFATRFLDTRIAFPRLHRVSMGICVIFASALAVAVAGGGHTLALLLAFSFVLMFTFGMVLLGAVSLYAGNYSARYFLSASIIAAVGATITALTVWGAIPYSPYGYRAVDIGVVIEAILLALALSEQFRRNQEQRIAAEQMARLDPLTGLNNRRAFGEYVNKLWKLGERNHHPMSLLVFDVDGFKSINDRFGHAQGDKVLVEIAKTIAGQEREEDILARWGGEEFILFMPATTLDEALVVAERIRASIEAIVFSIDEQTLSVTASVGVAQTEGKGDSLDKLISRADKHLYRAKESGRNRVCSGYISLASSGNAAEL